MNERRAPVIVDVLFALEWFLLVAAAIIPFLYFFRADDPLPFCMKIIACSAAYVLAALSARAEKLVVLRFIVPPAAVIGCVLLGGNTPERVILGVVGAFAVVCGWVIFYKLQRGETAYSTMIFVGLILLVLALVTRRLDMQPERTAAACTWVALLSALYLPLCIISCSLNRLQDALSVFRGRTEQPVTPIRKRQEKLIALAALAVFFVLLALPQDGGASLLGGLLAGAAYIGVGALTVLFSGLAVPRDCSGTTDNFGMGQMPEGGVESEAGWQMYVLYAVLALVLLALALFVLAPVIRSAIRRMLKKEGIDGLGENAKYDTVETIKAADKVSEDKRTARTNAARVRRIYRKRITSILGKEKNLRNSLTPAEIDRLCRKKGADVTELTRLYNKARYTLECTDEDVRAAQKL